MKTVPQTQRFSNECWATKSCGGGDLNVLASSARYLCELGLISFRFVRRLRRDLRFTAEFRNNVEGESEEAGR